MSCAGEAPKRQRGEPLTRRAPVVRALPREEVRSSAALLGGGGRVEERERLRLSSGDLSACVFASFFGLLR